MGKLSTRPRHPAGAELQPGSHALPGRTRDRHLLFLPVGAGQTLASHGRVEGPPGDPVPLLVMFAGSGSGSGSWSGSGSRSDPLRALRLVVEEAAAAGVAVLLPKSSGYTWDAVLGAFGPDVAELDRLLEAVSALIPVDTARLAAAGFSDGAPYALSIGRVNGDRFSRLLAFFPGFVMPGPPAGLPRMFVSRGTSDPVLSIDRCSLVLVPALRREGYDVDSREFDGGHVVPCGLVHAARAPLKAHR